MVFAPVSRVEGEVGDVGDDNDGGLDCAAAESKVNTAEAPAARVSIFLRVKTTGCVMEFPFFADACPGTVE
ncbi:hypothetical protein AO242_13600 [Pseudomonas sp. ICMP 561]|nr:hypothetical protein AO242_13600 [Pseudomonas sp. ICMP 561]